MTRLGRADFLSSAPLRVVQPGPCRTPGLPVLICGDGFRSPDARPSASAYLESGAGRIYAVREVLRVYLVHAGEISQIRHEAGGLDDLVQAGAGLFQNGFQIGEDLTGLLLDLALDQLAGGRVQRDLTRCEDEISCRVGLRVRAVGRRALCLLR